MRTCHSRRTVPALAPSSSARRSLSAIFFGDCFASPAGGALKSRFKRPRFNARLSVNYTGTRRLASVASSATVRPGSYSFYAPQTRIDLAFDVMLSRRYSFYGDVRNLTGAPLRRGTWSPDTPSHAKFDVLQFAGTLFTVGVRGRF